jgi:hypothetical protein
MTDYQERFPGIDVATALFRTSVLAFSPRFTAHILFGGTFLLALRVDPRSFIRFTGQVYKELKQGKADDVTPSWARRPTQYGADDMTSHAAIGFHEATGRKMGNLVLHEIMDRKGLDVRQVSSWLTAAAHLNYTFTNWVVQMQRGIAYYDGMAALIRRGERKGFILDETGQRVQVTVERAQEEGARASERVMGDLRKMTPLERNVFTKVMPFYGWTKHILKYVASYPMDHPYRAQWLSNLANYNSEEVPSGLATRIQLLFFLGSPSPNGDVSAIDVRALDPLRDTANYATWTGWLSALNPGLTALPAMIDPEIIFGNNVVYPTLTYSQLYGTREAAPSGGPITAIEQYIPQVQALDAALGISSQYRNLRKTDPQGFANTIFSALGIPFAQVQHINLKQEAAKNEISRYQVAAAAASSAWSSGDFSQIAGYPSVPDPLQPDYNISPAALQALYNELLRQSGGQPPSEVAVPLPAPAY